MKTFYVPYELFQHMKSSSNCWKTLVESEYHWKVGIPILIGGLDHIFETKKQFIFSDIGCNGLDNSFIVRSQTEIKQS